MAIHQKLGLQTRLSQRLILTPSLQQAIKLLPLTTLELAEVLEQEVTENPLLEEVPAQETAAEDAVAEEPAPEPERTEDPLKDIEVEKFFEDYFEDYAERRSRPTEVPEMPPIENTLTESTDLYDHLLWQLRMTASDEITMEIGDAIIQNLDEDGMLRVSLEEIANLGPYPMPEVEKALAVVQALDPPGVATRTLTECLRIQLRVLGLEGSPADLMVRDHMKELQSHQYGEIGRQMGLSPEEVGHHLEIIRHLDPKPGNRYSPDRSAYVLPDVFVVKEGEEYKIVLNDDGLPKLRISPTYRRMLEDKSSGTEETRAYVKDKLRSALWLLKSVDQRQRTIYRVAESIVRHQRAFLDHGVSHLRPLVLRDVASDIGMHESTVSRVVANKYIHTPRGVCAMRFFFHSGITSTMGEAVSSVTIKERIRKMIGEEYGTRPLSDSRIAEILEAEGLPLARRTVAKYREELRIPPSNLRKAVQ
ncbi:MAG: RNA polymerase sigma-54 factor [Acidobacteria bacterium RBG_16_70_10]|nr:MAG: RNA polymerase sigma-54 factor [Acidobacteria bacterium RBG_16_70_10]